MTNNDQLIELAARRLCEMQGAKEPSLLMISCARSDIDNLQNSLAYKAIQYATKQLEEDKQ